MSRVRELASVMQIILRSRPELLEPALWFVKSWLESQLEPGYVPPSDSLQALVGSYLKLLEIDEPMAFRGCPAFLEAAKSSPQSSKAAQELLLGPVDRAEKALPQAVKDGRLPADPAPVYFQVAGFKRAKETNNASLRFKTVAIGAYPRHLALVTGRKRKPS